MARAAVSACSAVAAAVEAFQLFSDPPSYTLGQGTRRGGFARRRGKGGAILRLKVFHQGWVQLPPELLEKEGIRAGDLAEVSVSRAGSGDGPFPR